MAGATWASVIAAVHDTGVAFDAGLTDAEVAAAEGRYAFRFPPDLRAFLQTGLPRGRSFPDWRSGDEAVLQDWLDLPRQGILLDIEHSNFWLDEWGPRPRSPEEARRVVNGLLAAAPRLIPVFGHRMMPAEPHLDGNPVFSVHQTDIIVYGADLRDYLVREFLARDDPGVWPIPDDIRQIASWDIERFQGVRWGPGGSCLFDDSRSHLP